MFVIMELLVVLIYLVAGMMLPINKYANDVRRGGPEAEQGAAYDKGAGAAPTCGPTYGSEYRWSPVNPI